jgi:hypothetical protein
MKPLVAASIFVVSITLTAQGADIPGNGKSIPGGAMMAKVE